MDGSRLRAATWIGLVVTPVLIAAGQVLFKLASRSVGDLNVEGILHLARNPYLVAALVVYGFGTVVWVYVLKAVPLTLAYSFMSLTFCAVPLLAKIFLHEPLTWRYVIGGALIMIGMIVINATP